MQKFVHKRTKTGTILVVADALRPLAPPVVYTGKGASKNVFGWKEAWKEAQGEAETGSAECTLNTHPHSASYQPVTYQPVSYRFYSATVISASTKSFSSTLSLCKQQMALMVLTLTFRFLTLTGELLEKIEGGVKSCQGCQNC